MSTQSCCLSPLDSGMQQGVDLNNLDCWPAPDSPSDRFLLVLMVKLILKQEIHYGAIWFPAAHCIIIRLLQRLMFLLIQGVSHFQYKKKLKQDLDSHPPINLSLPPILLDQPSNLVHYMTRQYSPASSWHVPEYFFFTHGHHGTDIGEPNNCWANCKCKAPPSYHCWGVLCWAVWPTQLVRPSHMYCGVCG